MVSLPTSQEMRLPRERGEYADLSAHFTIGLRCAWAKLENVPEKERGWAAGLLRQLVGEHLYKFPAIIDRAVRDG